ncbi:MAG TPA: tetratricopeptide repeat protein [Spirochaetia bacterium]|nr:tetratricopeptide repeat protein [Spirochaetia bacterium]
MDTYGLEIPDKQRLSEQYGSLIPVYEAVLDKIHHYLKGELGKRELRATVKTRVKSFHSYYRKLLNRMSSGTGGEPLLNVNVSGIPGREDLKEPITDVVGVRIVCPFLEQVETASALVQSAFEVTHFEEKGAERSFREFGYQSTHFLVRIPAEFRIEGLPEDSICEIQICTLLQDAWAEVEHELIYKAEFTPFDEPLRRKLAALNANLTLSDIIFQEIREYQRQLHAQLQKRRRDFLDRVQDSDASNLSQEPEVIEAPKDGISPTASLDDLLLQALYAHNEQKYSLAIRYYTRILDARPSTNLEAIVRVHRGMAHFANADYELALEDFKSAIKTDPKNGKAFYYRGIIYRMNREYRKALRDFDRSLELNPYEFDTLLSRSRVHYELGDLKKAIDDCENALRVEPQDVEALALRRSLGVPPR